MSQDSIELGGLYQVTEYGDGDYAKQHAQWAQKGVHLLLHGYQIIDDVKSGCAQVVRVESLDTLSDCLDAAAHSELSTLHLDASDLSQDTSWNKGHEDSMSLGYWKSVNDAIEHFGTEFYLAYYEGNVLCIDPHSGRYQVYEWHRGEDDE